MPASVAPTLEERSQLKQIAAAGALACPQPSFGETFLLRFTLIWSTRVGSLKSSNRNAARRCPLLLVRFTSPCHTLKMFRLLHNKKRTYLVSRPF